MTETPARLDPPGWHLACTRRPPMHTLKKLPARFSLLEVIMAAALTALLALMILEPVL